MLTAFDHVNIRTNNLDAMIAFYSEVLGLRLGDRPAFPFPGAWMYLGDVAHVHLVGLDAPQKSGGDIALEHFAFRAKGLTEFTKRLSANGVAFSTSDVPNASIRQVNFRDPDGNHIHVDFDMSEHRA